MNKDLIYLIGMPGCGKSTEGKKLAKKLGWQFVDLDVAIEKSEGKKITEIFKLKGEPYFRIVERQQLHQTTLLKQTVIACGGGTASYGDNIQFIKKNGLSIYLNASVRFLFNRIKASKTPRPMYLGLSDEEIFNKLEELLAFRRPSFSQAMIEINLPTESGKPLLDKVLEEFQKK